MENEFIKEGTTGFLATIATNSNEVFASAVLAAETFIGSGSSYGSCWGLHFEGPFLSHLRRGAHPSEFIQKADLIAVENLLLDRNVSGVVKMMTIAPEETSLKAVKYLRECGVTLSCGHSNATFEEGMNFFSARDITAVTHLYNAMPPLHHREPGLIAAVFESKPYTSIIVDGIHVNYTMVKLAKRELGSKLYLITDSVTATRDGVYPHVLVGDRYTMPDGTLSGSVLSLLRAVQNCVQYCGIGMLEALRMASAYPAEVIGVSDKKGYIAEGMDADFVIFDDNWIVRHTFIKGVCVFSEQDL